MTKEDGRQEFIDFIHNRLSVLGFDALLQVEIADAADIYADRRAQSAVDAALSDTLGLLETLAKDYGWVELGRGPRGGVYALLQVDCDTAGRTGLFYWNDLSYEFISRAEAEALLEVHDGA